MTSWNGFTEPARQQTRLGSESQLQAAEDVWRLCRDGARRRRADVLADLSGPAVGEDLDDNLMAGPGGVLPSHRLSGLVAAARLAMWDGRDAAEAAAWAAQAVAAFTPPGSPVWIPPTHPADALHRDPALWFATPGAARHPGADCAADLLRDIDGRFTPLSSVDVRVLLARNVDADTAILRLTRYSGPPGLALDAPHAAFTRWDHEFEAALQAAWWATDRPNMCVRWYLRWERSGRVADTVTGPSIGLAAAAALNQLVAPASWRLDADWAITGAIDEAGNVLSLMQATSSVSLYRKKLTAVGQRTVLIPEADYAAVAQLAARTQLPLRLEPVRHLRDLAGHELGSPAVVVEQCPYKGLEPFGVDDGGLFYGRQRLTAELVRRVHARPFVAVVGASGAGKSSLVRAGLIPALTKQTAPDQPSWHAVVMSPGATPFANLASALAALPGLPQAAPAADLEQALRTDVSHVRRTAGSLGPGRRVLLVIDQFEELFSLVSPPEMESFISMLCANVDESSPLTVLPVLRADYYGQLVQQPGIAALTADSQLVVGPLTAAELRDAVERPAMSFGLVVEPLLTDTVLADAARQPAVLPHLSVALQETWRRREANVLTVSGYHDAGGIAHALVRTADATLAPLSAPEKELARNIFLSLLSIPPDATPARRILARSDLKELTSSAMVGSMEAVLARFVEARLIVAVESGLQIVHDSLLESWAALARWVDDSRAERQLASRIGRDALEWQSSGSDPHQLYRGAMLQRGLEWRATTPFGQTDQVRAFLDASLRARRKTRLLRIVSLSALLTVAGTFTATRVSTYMAHSALLAKTRSPTKRLASGAKVELHPVTAGQYRACTTDYPACRQPGTSLPKNDSIAMVGLSQQVAATYCEWLGRRLPTYSEMEDLAANDSSDPDLDPTNIDSRHREYTGSSGLSDSSYIRLFPPRVSAEFPPALPATDIEFRCAAR